MEKLLKSRLDRFLDLFLKGSYRLTTAFVFLKAGKRGFEKNRCLKAATEQFLNFGGIRNSKVLKHNKNNKSKLMHGQIVYFAVCRNGNYQIYAGKITKVKKKSIRLAVSGDKIIERSRENIYEDFEELKKLIQDSKKFREQNF